MKRHKLKRRLHDYLSVILTMTVSGVQVVSSYDYLFRRFGHTFWFYTWLVVFLAYLTIFCFYVVFPLMEIKNRELSFSPANAGFFKRVRLPLGGIDGIAEHKRKTGGFAKLIELPTFLVRMKDGSVFEYFPKLKSGKELNDVREFLERVTAPRGIEPVSEEQAVLEVGGAEKRFGWLIMIIVGSLIFMVLLAHLTTPRTVGPII